MPIPAADAGPPRPDATAARPRWRWDTVTFVHFEVEPGDLQAVLPSSLRVDTFDGAGWAGLVLVEVRGTSGRRSPWLMGRFGMAEVRVPVRGPDGEPAVYVAAADVGSPLAALAGRFGGRLPARWATMSVERDVAERLVTYACRRRLPGSGEASCACAVRVGGSVAPTMTDRFLLDRSVRFAASGPRGRARRLVPSLGPLPLYDAVIESLDDRLLAAAGLPEPQGRMVVRFSPGVDVGPGRLGTLRERT